MRVLLITNLFPTPRDPERGVFIQQMVKRLEAYCRITVVCPLPWFPDSGPLARVKAYREYTGIPRQYEIDGIKVYAPRYPFIPKISSSFHARLMFTALRKTVQSLVRCTDFDLINSHWLYPDGVAAAWIARSLGIPHIPTGRGCDVNRDIYDPRKRDQIIETLENSSALILVSRGLKQELEKNDIRLPSTHVIPNGVDLEKFHILPKAGCRDRLGINESFPLLLYVGRLSQEKGIHSLIGAVAQLAASGKDFKLYLVGDGPLRAELQDLAVRHGIGERVHFVGKVDHNEVAYWMGSADFLCLPSLREGCPNVILEALGSGRPVLASEVGAIPDFVNADTGILFTPENVESISHALTLAGERDWDADVINRSIAGFSWEETARRYFDVFQSCCETLPRTGAQEK